MRNLVAAASIVVLLAGCLAPADEAQLLAEKAVKANLRDPGSAVFAEPYVIETGPDADGWVTQTVCGQVNARNGFGGYAGNARYVSITRRHPGMEVQSTRLGAIENPLEDKATVSSKDTDKPETVFEHVYWNPSCSGAGYPASYTGRSDY